MQVVWRSSWFTDGAPDASPHHGVLVDDGYLVGRIRRGLDQQPYAWVWWMVATSRFGGVDQLSGIVSTEADAKRATEAAYAAFCRTEGAREDFFASTAAREMAAGNWRK